MLPIWVKDDTRVGVTRLRAFLGGTAVDAGLVYAIVTDQKWILGGVSARVMSLVVHDVSKPNG